MKRKFIIGMVSVFSILVSFFIYQLSFTDANVKAQSQSQKQVSKNMLDELRKEQKLIQQERQRLQQYEQNLKSFESELDKRYNEFLLKEKKLNEREADFNKKLEEQTVDRQVIETYESIDPEQAAVLIKNLYIKDSELATLLMRKIAGKKAGKILEAMIPVDREVSTQLAKRTLDYYKPKD
jgi:flagellar motility protein MotE (MotC chaperone)